MALFFDGLKVNDKVFDKDVLYKIDDFTVYKSNGMFGEHWNAIVKSGEIVNYIPNNGAKRLAENLNDARTACDNGELYFSLTDKHSKRYNKDYVACDFFKG